MKKENVELATIEPHETDNRIKIDLDVLLLALTDDDTVLEHLNLLKMN